MPTNEASDRRLSKAMAWWLRHAPDEAGITTDPAGWVPIDELLRSLSRRNPGTRRDDVLRVATTGDKPRYELSDDQRMIRARYGHSRPVDLGLEPATPPDTLFHGTARAAVAAILQQGLQRRGRQAVHLSETVDDAHAVGARHGPPAVLAVDAGRLHAQGQRFFRAAPGIWLTAAVPSTALRPTGD